MELSSEDELDSVDLPVDAMKHRCSSLTIYPLDYKYSLGEFLVQALFYQLKFVVCNSRTRMVLFPESTAKNKYTVLYSMSF